MKKVKIVPYASHNQRDFIPITAGTFVSKDQRLINVYPEVIKNAITGKMAVSLKRRPGFIASIPEVSNVPGSPYYPTALGEHYAVDQNISYPMVSYTESTTLLSTRLYLTIFPVGVIKQSTVAGDYTVRKIDYISLNSVGINIFSVGDGYSLGGTYGVPSSIWFYPYTNFPGDATSTSTFAAATSTSSTTLTLTASTSTTNFYVGQAVSGAGIAAGARISTIPTTSTLTLTVSSSAVSTVTLTREILAKVIDPDLPTNLVGGTVTLKGWTFCASRDARIYNFDINSVTAITPGNYISADDYPDSGLGIIKHGDEVVHFGTNSIQFFYVAGNPTGSPLSVVQNATIDIGVSNELAYCSVGNKFAFISFGQLGKSFWIVTGRSPQKVSSSREDAILSDGFRWIVSTCVIDGQVMIFLFCKDRGIVLVYCLDSGGWWELNANSMSQAMAIGAFSFLINSTNTNGFLQRMSIYSETLSYKDAISATSTGSVTTATAIIDIGDLGEDGNKSMPRIAFDADTQVSTSNLYVSFSDDDYQTFTSSRAVDLTKERKELTRNGGFRHRVIKMEHSDDTGFRLRVINADIL